MEWLTEQRYAAELEAEARRLGAAATRRPPEEIVETCPEWTVRRLVSHVGTGHRYIAGIVETGDRVEYELLDAPGDPAGWTEWLVAGARRLNSAVAARSFTGHVASWHPRHPTAAFWQRRMVHDQIVHRFDAEPGGDLAADLAANGVTDLLTAFEMVEKLGGDGETLLFTATDLDHHWHVTRTLTGIDWHEIDSHGGEAGPADVTVAAPARDLLLILNRRLPSPAVEGDVDRWTSWHEASRF